MKKGVTGYWLLCASKLWRWYDDKESVEVLSEDGKIIIINRSCQ